MVHVAFGDPYVIGSAPSASTALLAWSGTTTAQRAAARALVGTADVSGRLPITMPPTYGLGAGRRLPATGAP
jgi:beta-N-acetylhexosaminidase